MKRKASASFRQPPKKKIAKSRSLINPPMSRQSLGMTPEKKWVDVSSNSTLAVGNSVVNYSLLNGIATGTTSNTRIGRSVQLLSLTFRWFLQFQASSTGGGPARVLIVYDKQTNGVAPLTLDVLAANDYNSTMNLTNKDRFLILSDTLTPPISVNGDSCVSGTVYRKLNLRQQFNANTAGNAGDIVSGSIHVIFGQTGTIGVAAPILSWSSRIRYTDV